MSKYHDHRSDCPFKFASLDVCDCVEHNMLDRIEALEAKLAKAVETLKVISQFNATESNSINTRAIWRMTDRASFTLAEIKGEQP